MAALFDFNEVQREGSNLLLVVDMAGRTEEFHLAQELGINVDAAADQLRAEFGKAQARQQAVIDTRAFDAMIGRLTGVRDSHRR